MRVLHVYKNFYPTVGGIENHIRVLCRELVRLGGVEPAVLVANTTRRTTIDLVDGVPILRAARLGFAASTPLSVSLVLHMARQQADITHLHFPYPVGELAYLLAGQSKRLVVSYHSDIVKQKKLPDRCPPLIL